MPDKVRRVPVGSASGSQTPVFTEGEGEGEEASFPSVFFAIPVEEADVDAGLLPEDLLISATGLGVASRLCLAVMAAPL
jgi:hypothetical protein